MTSKSYFGPASFLPAKILKNPIFGVFEAKYLRKFLSISGKTYFIRIVSSPRIFEKKWGTCHMHFKNEKFREIWICKMSLILKNVVKIHELRYFFA